MATLPPEVQERHRADVRGFIGQEATHRRIHSLFNAHLEQQGLVDRWTARASQRMELMDGADPRHALAVTAATEHFTAMFAEWLLARPRSSTAPSPGCARCGSGTAPKSWSTRASPSTSTRPRAAPTNGARAGSAA